MTKQEYADYEATVAEFFSHGLNNLSSRGESFFSWRPCQCCGTHLGGDRYECDGYNGQTEEVEEYDCVCSDCVYYAEYGQLDDQTMLDIEASDE